MAYFPHDLLEVRHSAEINAAVRGTQDGLTTRLPPPHPHNGSCEASPAPPHSRVRHGLSDDWHSLASGSHSHTSRDCGGGAGRGLASLWGLRTLSIPFDVLGGTSLPETKIIKILILVSD